MGTERGDVAAPSCHAAVASVLACDWIVAGVPAKGTKLLATIVIGLPEVGDAGGALAPVPVAPVLVLGAAGCDGCSKLGCWAAMPECCTLLPATEPATALAAVSATSWLVLGCELLPCTELEGGLCEAPACPWSAPAPCLPVELSRSTVSDT